MGGSASGIAEPCISAIWLEGARSYLEACTAIIEYQREVQKKCRRVMEHFLGDFGAAINVDDFKPSDIEDVSYPEFETWDGSWWSIGVRISRKNLHGLPHWEGYCCLTCEQSENRALYCYVGEWYTSSRLARQLLQKFRVANGAVSLEDEHDNDVGLKESLTAEEMSTFEEKLERLFAQWIEVWKKVGGMKMLLER